MATFPNTLICRLVQEVACQCWKLNLFHLTVWVTMLLMQKWMSLALMKSFHARYLDYLLFDYRLSIKSDYGSIVCNAKSVSKSRALIRSMKFYLPCRFSCLGGCLELLPGIVGKAQKRVYRTLMLHLLFLLTPWLIVEM